MVTIPIVSTIEKIGTPVEKQYDLKLPEDAK